MQKSKNSYVYRLFHKQQLKEAEDFILKNARVSLYDDKKVVNAVSHMTAYKEKIYIPKMKLLLEKEKTLSHEEYWTYFLNLVGDYSDEVCKFSGISTTPTDYYLFMSFELMHNWINDENLKKYYSGYEDYILCHVDNWHK